jgi:hypothetical protein
MKADATLLALALFALGPPAAMIYEGLRRGENPFSLVLVGIMLGFVAVAALAYALVRAADRRWPETLSPAMAVRRFAAAWLLVLAVLAGAAYLVFLLVQAW